MKPTPRTINTPLPWHRTLWKQWYTGVKQVKLPHALLLHGPAKSGKTQFIKAFTQLILCHQPQYNSEDRLYHSCRQCAACVWYQANTHPNYYEIKPRSSGTGKSYISIDQIRDLAQNLQQTAITSTKNSNQPAYHTIVVIDPIDALQIPASPHALLKTLEEPPVGVLFILTTTQPKNLLATIRSRCQLRKLPQPEDNQSVAWLKTQLSKEALTVDPSLLALSLQLANHRPLQALYYLQNNEIELYQSILHSLILLNLGKIDPVEVAKTWLTYPIDKILEYLMLANVQFIRWKLGDIELDSKYIELPRQELVEWIQTASLEFLYQYWNTLSDIRRKINLYSLNISLVLERLAYTFSSSRNFS